MAEKKTNVGTSFEECIRRVMNGEYECRRMPEADVETGEVVLGTLENPIARSVYSLKMEMTEGLKKFLDSLPDDPSSLSKSEIIRYECQNHQYKNRIQSADYLFWELVYSSFPKAREKGVSVGIRSGWQVVIFKRSQWNFLDMLSGNS